MPTIPVTWDLNAHEYPIIYNNGDIIIPKQLLNSPLLNPSYSRWIQVPDESVLNTNHRGQRFVPKNRIIFKSCPVCKKEHFCFGALLEISNKNRSLMVMHCLTKKLGFFGYCSLEAWINIGLSIDGHLTNQSV